MTDVDLILKKFRYDPDTGVITRAKDGKRVDRPTPAGYRRVSVNRKFGHRLAHRMAILFQSGEWPPEGMHVHHVNADRSDNRWDNLEVVTPRENNAAKVQREDSNIRAHKNKLQVSVCTTVDDIDTARALRNAWQKATAEILGKQKKG